VIIAEKLGLNEEKATEDLSKPTNPDVKGVGKKRNKKASS